MTATANPVNGIEPMDEQNEAEKIVLGRHPVNLNYLDDTVASNADIVAAMQAMRDAQRALLRGWTVDDPRHRPEIVAIAGQIDGLAKRMAILLWATSLDDRTHEQFAEAMAGPADDGNGPDVYGTAGDVEELD